MTSATAVAGPPRYLRCEYLTDPVGIDEVQPRLSWEVSDHRRGAAQTAYEVIVASSAELLAADEGDRWATGRVPSAACAQVAYAGVPLGSRMRCWWKVRTWDHAGEASPWSATAFFEMGLVAPLDLDGGPHVARAWRGGVIRRPARGDGTADVAAPFFRRPFDIDGDVESARLYITAFGVYEAHLNGHVVSADVLRPGWTDYRIRVPYQVYDVTALLRRGANVLGAIVGDGWYCGRNAIVGGSRQAYGDRPELIAQLEVSVAGRTETLFVATDTTWMTSAGPILSSDHFDGEVHDARLELTGWSEPGYDDSAWTPAQSRPLPAVALVASVAPPVRRTQELTPVDSWEVAPGTRVHDLGQNIAGRVRVTVRAPAGTVVRLRHSEALNGDRTLWTDNLRSAAATDTYVCAGRGEETWEPRFTFHGFRYVEVSGAPADVVGVALHSDMPRSGTFTCSDPAINRLYENVVWSQRGNSVDVPTDCPQRDERLGWTGDVVSFAPTAAFNYDVAAFFTKWVTDLLDSQLPSGVEAGQFPMFAPRGAAAGGGPAWADAGIDVPWLMYVVYGDERVLERTYPALERWMGFLDRQAAGRAPGSWAGFGDWCSLDFDADRPLGHPLGQDERWGGTPLPLLRDAFHTHAADLMSRIATVLQRGDDAGRWKQRREQLREQFASHHLVEGRLRYTTQTACALVLQLDLVDDEAARARIAADLAADVERRGHLVTGFVGTPHLLHALDSAGRTDLAYTLVERREYPGWLFEVDNGATTIWERWDAWTPDRGFMPGDAMNSLNHYAYGSVGSWLQRTMGGLALDPSRPGADAFVVAPRPGGSITAARVAMRTLRGAATCAWTVDAGALTVEVTIPPGATARVSLPVGPGAGVVESGDDLEHAAGVSGVRQSAGVFDCDVVAGSYVFEVR